MEGLNWADLRIFFGPRQNKNWTICVMRLGFRAELVLDIGIGREFRLF